METRILRKTALLCGILLIGILIMGQSAMAVRPDSPTCTITEAFVVFEPGAKTVTIHGRNFDCDDLIVTVGDYDPLTVTSCSPDPDEIIEANLPEGIGAGDYLLKIQCGPSNFQSDTYNLTIGAVGPEGPQGECDCPITQEQLGEIYDRIAYLESFIPRFTDMADGTIRDNDTGLLWLKNANCFGSMDWWDALEAADLLAAPDCGLSDGSVAGDWRLPTKAEWEAFYSTVYDNPALVNTIGNAQWSEGDAFTGVQSVHYCWSSTEYDSNTAWSADMYDGDMQWYAKVCYGVYVWPVRSDN